MARTRLNHKMSFFENRRNCSPSELHGGSLFRTFNSYSLNFNGGLRKRRIGFCLLRNPSPRGKQILWFLKIDPLLFHRIYLLYDWSNLLVFSMCLLRINLPNLCPNIIYVDASDFSGWHSKEVISFFWCSVYIKKRKTKNIHWTLLNDTYFVLIWGNESHTQYHQEDSVCLSWYQLQKVL